jgi:UDP-2,3-diacylglucosamine pyrophosphatase LpxH
MSPVFEMQPLKCRSIWISDVHLGFKGCRADFLLDFLHSTECEYLFLVGDIIDVWNMKKGVYWPQEHNNVVRSILGKAKHDTKVIFIPGNHDEVFREYDGMTFGNVMIRNEYVHTTADGKRLLMLHGDEFDSVVKYSKLLAMLGNTAYDWLLYWNRIFNQFRRACGFPYWSLAAYLKQKVKNAVKFISDFEQAVVHEAKKRNVDGLVCGHIHHAEITAFDDVLYCNCGDWVESHTALVEGFDGNLQLMHWSERKHTVKDVASEQSIPEVTDNAA